MHSSWGSVFLLQTYNKQSEYIKLMESRHPGENMIWLFRQKNTRIPEDYKRGKTKEDLAEL